MKKKKKMMMIKEPSDSFSCSLACMRVRALLFFFLLQIDIFLFFLV